MEMKSDGVTIQMKATVLYKVVLTFEAAYETI